MTGSGGLSRLWRGDLPNADDSPMGECVTDEIAFEDQHWLHLRLTDRLCAVLDSLNVFLGTQETSKANPNRIVRIPKEYRIRGIHFLRR
jgi:hypothetical protein